MQLAFSECIQVFNHLRDIQGHDLRSYLHSLGTYLTRTEIIRPGIVLRYRFQSRLYHNSDVPRFSGWNQCEIMPIL